MAIRYNRSTDKEPSLAVVWIGLQRLRALLKS